MTITSRNEPAVVPRTVVIVGPTASGKSSLALALADHLGSCEIVSVDSMQVYRGMDIGTAKPTKAEQSLVPHHMIDMIDPCEEGSVAWFQKHALAAIDEISDRGNRAILVGGTGLYHRAVIDRLRIPPQFPEIRAGLEAIAQQSGGTASLYSRLAERDPLAASRTEPTNARRIVRALEVCEGTGDRFSAFGPGLEAYEPSPHLLVGLTVDRPEMRGRISNRVDQMVEDGFVDEVRELRQADTPWSRTAAQALGYCEVADALDGTSTIAEAIAQTIDRTRQFAVRQDRWFRRDPRIRWIGSNAAETQSFVANVASTLEET